MLNNIKKSWQQHELISCLPQGDRVYCHKCREQLMKWNEEVGQAHLLSGGIQQNLQRAIVAVSRHSNGCSHNVCLGQSTNHMPFHKRQERKYQHLFINIGCSCSIDSFYAGHGFYLQFKGHLQHF